MAAIVRDNAADYRRQLMAYAMKVAKDEGVAEELVQWAFQDILESDAESVDGNAIYYLCRMVHSKCLSIRRGKSQLALQRWRQASADDPFGSVFGEIQKLSTPATQLEGLEMTTVLRAIEALPAEQRRAIQLAGLGYDVQEIAKIMGMSRRMATDRIENARRALAAATGYERDKKWSKSGFRGVRKHGFRWVAEQQSSKLGRLYLGTFDTAEEAALAFDLAALARLGDRAILNFPHLKTELAA